MGRATSVQLENSIALLLILAALVLPGCEGTGGNDRALECFSIEDCPNGSVCFLGACTDPNYKITSVYAEMSPPSDSPHLQQVSPDRVDLSAGLFDLSLRQAVTISGKVLAEGVAPDVTGLTGLLQAETTTAIPGHNLLRQAAVSGSGYDLAVLPGTQTLTFTPNQGSQPPIAYAGQEIQSDGTWNLTYPAARLVSIQGRVRYTAALPPNVEGATVSGTAVDSSGATLRSTSALTDGNGEYTLFFPPDATVFTLTVGPGTNLDIPKTTRSSMTITAAPNWVDDIVLGVLPAVEIDASVKDALGEPVGRASVYFAGEVGAGHFTYAGSTDDQGNVKTKLWPGEYVVTVAPYKTDPWALTTSRVTIDSAAAPVYLTVSRKVQLSGTVRAFDGTPVTGAAFTLTRRGRALPREFSSATDGDGAFLLAVDPGDSLEDAEYELTIQPDLKSRLPYFRELIRIGTGDLLHDVRLYDATLAAGRIRDPGGAPLANVVVTFYSPELATDQPRMVGVGRTNSIGELVVPLPAMEQ
ncbi:MAG: hypothetical protein HY903_10860 [Deltaproteobacteria bacterium]|nr:hypothetical protein [Deltaproteobacteria bacterium]